MFRLKTDSAKKNQSIPENTNDGKKCKQEIFEQKKNHTRSHKLYNFLNENRFFFWP